MTRIFRRLLLTPRARRVKFEREMIEVFEFLQAIKDSARPADQPPWNKRADDE